jgi:hypothetical protein
MSLALRNNEREGIVKLTNKLLLYIGLSTCSATANATYHTTDANNVYTIALDNGVVYISHPQFVAPCLYGRVEIRSATPYSADYTKRLIAAIFMAKASGKDVALTWDDAPAPTCLLNSVSISN